MEYNNGVGWQEKNGKFIKHFQSNAHISSHQRFQTFQREDSNVDVPLDKGKLA